MSTQTLHLALPPGPVSAKMNRVGSVGCTKPEERLEEKPRCPPTPATLPHGVCKARFPRAPQALTRSPAPLATSEIEEEASPS